MSVKGAPEHRKKGAHCWMVFCIVINVHSWSDQNCRLIVNLKIHWETTYWSHWQFANMFVNEVSTTHLNILPVAGYQHIMAQYFIKRYASDFMFKSCSQTSIKICINGQKSSLWRWSFKSFKDMSHFWMTVILISELECRSNARTVGIMICYFNVKCIVNR